MCSGRVDERLMLKAFAIGADGALVCGYNSGDYHYQKGNLSARRRVTGLKPFLKALGISQERLRREWVLASESPKVAETARNSTETIKGLGPSLGHQPSLFPEWLAEQGVSVVIAGGMGSRAQSLFNQNRIGVIINALESDPEKAVLSYLEGTLARGEDICDH